MLSKFNSTPAGKRPSGRPRHRWEDNIRMDLKEIDINMRNWVHLAQDKDYWRALVKDFSLLAVIGKGEDDKHRTKQLSFKINQPSCCE